MFVGENDRFPPLTSASLRLLFDFLPALMSRSDKEKPHMERRRARKRQPNAMVISTGKFSYSYSTFGAYGNNNTTRLLPM